MSIRVVGFGGLKEEYECCLDIKDIFLSLPSGQIRIAWDFHLQDGYLFSVDKLCIPNTSVRDFIVWETHVGGLPGYFRQDKTIEEVERKFYWPRLKSMLPGWPLL